MKKRLMMMAVFMLFLFPIASAATVELTIHTLPIHDVSVFILDAGEKYESLASFPVVRTGFDGLATFNFTVDKSEFGLSVLIKKNEETVFSERLDNQASQAKSNVYVLIEEGEVFGELPELDGTEEDVVEETTEEIVVEETADLTGNVVADDGNGPSNLVYIIIGVVLLVVVAGFIIMKNKNSILSSIKSDNRPPTILADQELEDAEKKIKEAEREIKNIKENTTKRAKAQQKFLDAKKDLEKAEGTYDPKAYEEIEEGAKETQKDQPDDDIPKKEDFQ